MAKGVPRGGGGESQHQATTSQVIVGINVVQQYFFLAWSAMTTTALPYRIITIVIALLNNAAGQRATKGGIGLLGCSLFGTRVPCQTMRENCKMTLIITRVAVICVV